MSSTVPRCDVSNRPRTHDERVDVHVGDPPNGPWPFWMEGPPGPTWGGSVLAGEGKALCDT